MIIGSRLHWKCSAPAMGLGVQVPPSPPNFKGYFMGKICFFGHSQPCFCFSNFYKSPINLNGKTWRTTEHYYQAMKYEGTEYEEIVRSQLTARKAAEVGRSGPLRSDWEVVKEKVMYIALVAKFTQHKDLKEALLQTGDNELIEASPYDSYWGSGSDGNGKNRLGVLLMKLREELKNGEV